MRTLFVAIAFAACAGMAEPPPQLMPFDNPAYSEPAKPWTEEDALGAVINAQACKDTLKKIRGEDNLPDVEDDEAPKEEPLLFKAVDKRINDCSVLVMSSDTKDIRPIPEAKDDPKPTKKAENSAKNRSF